MKLNKSSPKSIVLTSFGYKSNEKIHANMLFDVRFLDNPFWEPALRDLTGLDQPVKNYVLDQVAAKEFVDDVVNLMTKYLDKSLAKAEGNFTIAIGCTGGQHRSVAVIEALANQIINKFASYHIIVKHRELHYEKEINTLDVPLKS